MFDLGLALNAGAQYLSQAYRKKPQPAMPKSSSSLRQEWEGVKEAWNNLVNSNEVDGSTWSNDHGTGSRQVPAYTPPPAPRPVAPSQPKPPVNTPSASSSTGEGAITVDPIDYYRYLEDRDDGVDARRGRLGLPPRASGSRSKFIVE